VAFKPSRIERGADRPKRKSHNGRKPPLRGRFDPRPHLGLRVTTLRANSNRVSGEPLTKLTVLPPCRVAYSAHPTPTVRRGPNCNEYKWTATFQYQLENHGRGVATPARAVPLENLRVVLAVAMYQDGKYKI